MSWREGRDRARAARPDFALTERNAWAVVELCRRLRGASQSEWVERLQAEAGNLAAAVRWYPAHNPGPLPHLFRVLWPFWSQRITWTRPAPGSTSCYPAPTHWTQARAELLWTVTVTAREVGDDAMALSARQRLAPLLDGIATLTCTRRPSWPWRGPHRSLMAWTAPCGSVGLPEGVPEPGRAPWDCCGRPRPRLRGGDRGPLRRRAAPPDQARDLAVRLDKAWLTATSQVLRGTLALVQGRLEDAQALLEEALDLSLAARSTQLVTVCLAGFARLAFVGGVRSGRRCWRGGRGPARRVGLRAAASPDHRHHRHPASPSP